MNVVLLDNAFGAEIQVLAKGSGLTLHDRTRRHGQRIMVKKAPLVINAKVYFQ